MITKLEQKNYSKVLPLVTSKNELSVRAVLTGRMPGQVYVNKSDGPTAALIRTSECNYVTGTAEDKEFNRCVGEILDFWDPLTPDNEEWGSSIPAVHKDYCIRSYTRRHYELALNDWKMPEITLPEGYVLEEADPEKLRECGYDNADELLDWIGNWGDEKAFMKFGAGCYVRCDRTIVSWSLSDCSCENRIAIGIHTAEGYRRKGLAKIAASGTIEQCRRKGYEIVEWLCVDFNIGSRTLAESLGFQLQNTYEAYSSYAPVENMTDLTKEDWLEWAQYFEQGSKTEPILFEECIYTYVKADQLDKVKELLLQCENREEMKGSIAGFIPYLKSMGMAKSFTEGWNK